MKSVAMIGTKHWNNAYAVMRTANGLGFYKVYLVDLAVCGGKPPKMNRRKIDLKKPPYDMYEIISKEQFIQDVLPNHNGVSMELTDNAVNLKEYTWKSNPIVIVGPENGNIPDDVLAVTDQVKVPMMGLVNCFNVACAASIAMWDCCTK